MEKPKELTLFDSPKNRARVRRYFYLSLVVLLVVDFFTLRHGHFPWEAAWAFYAAYGFIGCVGLIFIARVLRRLVQREENYYD